MKIFILILSFTISSAIFSNTCIETLIKNNIPQSKAELDCKNTVAHYEKTVIRTVKKVTEVPIYGRKKPDWMTREDYNKTLDYCYNNSRSGYNTACDAGYSMSDSNCSLATYKDGQQIREHSSKPRFEDINDCYKQRKVYGQISFKREEVEEPIYGYTSVSYEDLLQGKIPENLHENTKTTLNQIKNCMDIVNQTPRKINGMKEEQINSVRGKKYKNSVFAVCNSWIAPTIVANKECFQEINSNEFAYPVTTNLIWDKWDPKPTCKKLLERKNSPGFKECVNEIKTQSFSTTKSTYYLTFLNEHTAYQPEIESCLEIKNLSWFANKKNIDMAHECVQNIKSQVTPGNNYYDINAGLTKCYQTNLSKTCAALSKMTYQKNWDFQLCSKKQLEYFNKMSSKSCSLNTKQLCQFECLKFMLSYQSEGEAISSCKNDFSKIGNNNFQHCFTQIYNGHGGNLSISDTIAFCPKSESEINSQLGQEQGIFQDIMNVIYK